MTKDVVIFALAHLLFVIVFCVIIWYDTKHRK